MLGISNAGGCVRDVNHAAGLPDPHPSRTLRHPEGIRAPAYRVCGTTTAGIISVRRDIDEISVDLLVESRLF